ncbi:transport and Golgi organization protein 1 homolog [Tamandua tetradactyla]|uniref:transport and Golgi organization protein 1 homolog n=1 Tax=Tamandua tetradactyla TaxID=48850 RepID=UPI0040547B8D
MGFPRLLFWLILLGSPDHLYSILPDTLPDSFRSGSDFLECLWKSIIVAAYLGIALFAIFIWSTVLAVKPRKYQVNLQQISNKIKTFKHETAEIAQKISMWEQKISKNEKCITEAKRQVALLSDQANTYQDNIKTVEMGNGNLKKIIERACAALKFKRNETIETQFLKENTCLRDKREQVQKKIEGQRKEQSEILEKIKFLENTQNDLERAVTEKDNQASVNCISQLNGSYESEFEDKNPDINEEITGGTKRKMKIQMTSMMDDSQAKTAILSLEDDLKLLQFKLKSSKSIKYQEEYQKQLENDCKSVRSAKAAMENEILALSMKLELSDEFYQKRMKSAEKKLEREKQRQQEVQRQLSDAEGKFNLVSEEVQNYKQRIEELKQRIEEAENSFKEQIDLYEKEEHENWVRACDLERAVVEERRNAAYLKHRLDTIQVKAQEGCGIKAPMPGRLDLQAVPHGDAGPHTTLMENSNTRSSFPANMMEEVNMAARGPPPFQGPPFMYYPMRGPPLPQMGYQPIPPPWWVFMPHSLPPCPPFGPTY